MAQLKWQLTGKETSKLVFPQKQIGLVPEWLAKMFIIKLCSSLPKIVQFFILDLDLNTHTHTHRQAGARRRKLMD